MRSKATRRFRYRKLARLLVLGSLVSLCAPAEHLPGTFDVSIEDSTVSVHALDANVDALLAEVAAKAGFRLIRFAEIDQTITIRIDNSPLQAALLQLLPGQSYQFFDAGAGSFGTDQTDMLWIIAEGEPVELAAIEFLESVLLHGDVLERQQAIRKLQQIASPASIRALSFALADESPAVQRQAFASLQRIGNDEALAVIASAGLAAEAWLRGEAAAALAGDSAASSLRYLQESLGDNDANVRIAAIDSLSELDDERVVELISRALDDPDPMVREHAADALEHVGDEVAFRAMLATQKD